MRLEYYYVTIDGSNTWGPVELGTLRQWMQAGHMPPIVYIRSTLSDVWAAYPFAPGGKTNALKALQLERALERDAEQCGAELERMQGQLDEARSIVREAEKLETSLLAKREELASLKSSLAGLADRRKEIEAVEEALEIQSFGFYQPKYNLGSSGHYARQLKDVREQQKRLVKDGSATLCQTEWRVQGSLAAGRAMVKQQSKLMLRAFNGECDAAIAKVRYDSVVAMEQRISRSCEAISDLGKTNGVSISLRYRDLKLAELRLVHEHREKVQQEKEEAKRLREEEREALKAQEELDRARAKAEEDEAKQQHALEKARADLANAQAEDAAASAKQISKLEGLVSKLETELSDAIDRKAKAIARAQLTKSGHVYVLSNVGSFGVDVFKIGLTRRLDPLERVEELGSASVPFPFDVHAIIFSKNAPALEHALHLRFAAQRVNLVNARKEYFRISLDAVRAAIQELHGLVSFVLTPEAEEWRKTQAALTAGAPPSALPMTTDQAIEHSVDDATGIEELEPETTEEGVE